MSNTEKPTFIEPEMVRIIHQKPEKAMKFTMVRVPKGTFMMGSKENDDEQPVHEVTINYEFEIGKYQVTIKEYMAFVEDTQKHYPEWLEKGNEYHIETGTDDYYKKSVDFSDHAPIVGVSWHDAMAYCAWLSEKSGHAFTLPSEAQWEYACRAGTTTRWSFGDDEKELKKHAWYSNNSNGKTHPVGEKEKNPWGLCDMHGNVWEWCADDYVRSYKDTPRDGTAYKDKKVGSKVCRGGSWGFIAFWARSADRNSRDPGDRLGLVGFRLLRTLP